MIEPQATDIGRKVVYMNINNNKPEEGVITSFNERFVFVRYGADTHSKATNRAALKWAS
jgi:hypothetical protein